MTRVCQQNTLAGFHSILETRVSLCPYVPGLVLCNTTLANGSNFTSLLFAGRGEVKNWIRTVRDVFRLYQIK